MSFTSYIPALFVFSSICCINKGNDNASSAYNNTFAEVADTSILDKQDLKSIYQLADILRENYVFEDMAESMHDTLHYYVNKGKFNGMGKDEISAFIHELLRGMTHDKHLRIVSSRDNNRPPVERYRPENHEQGIGYLEMGDDSIGYWEITAFEDFNKKTKQHIAQQFALSTNAKALILDLSENRGGHPSSVQYLCSFLFPEGEEVLLNSLYFRNRDQKTDFYTLDNDIGSRIPDLPVYIIVSEKTFSAAEEFTYNLKTRKRAVIVGKTTGGGAHPVHLYTLKNDMVAIVPEGRAINPITQDNWEGKGISPDIEVDPVNAKQAILNHYWTTSTSK